MNMKHTTSPPIEQKKEEILMRNLLLQSTVQFDRPQKWYITPAHSAINIDRAHRIRLGQLYVFATLFLFNIPITSSSITNLSLKNVIS